MIENKKKRMSIEVVYHFRTEGEPVSAEPYGGGHINTTFLVTTSSGKRYILQKIKDTVFDPPQLMENIQNVIRLAREKGAEEGSFMNLVETEDGKPYYQDDSGAYRLYDYIEGTVCLQVPETMEDFYQSALAFGAFQRLMEGFPAEKLHETIPDFHNTIDRYRKFKKAVQEDLFGRVSETRPEIDYILAQEEDAELLSRLLSEGKLPLRVTHNDTKLNNVLLDEKTRKFRCVIDLDTVMPGLAGYDFGDGIRFGAATAGEDEKDVSLMKLNLEAFRVFARGFLEAGPRFTELEVETFPMGAFAITVEQAVRFLTDYLEGDRYYHTEWPGQNLVRTRTQVKLAREMKAHMKEMEGIVREEAARAYGEGGRDVSF